ncbi:MAG: DNA repair protein RecO [Pseudomonadota bacterium]
MGSTKQQKAYLLHRQDYRDTSNLLTVLTPDDGRVSLIAQGARRPKTPLKAILQAFQCCELEWRESRSDLGLLLRADFIGPATHLSGRALFAGFYVNELLVRLLSPGVSDPQFFEQYHQTVINLSDNSEPVLRLFEKNLLLHLGYGLDLWQDKSGQDIDPQATYHYFFEQNFVRLVQSDDPQGLKIPGEALCALREEKILPQHRMVLKMLFRQILQHYLGKKPIMSRQFWWAYD